MSLEGCSRALHINWRMCSKTSPLMNPNLPCRQLAANLDVQNRIHSILASPARAQRNDGVALSLRPFLIQCAVLFGAVALGVISASAQTPSPALLVTARNAKALVIVDPLTMR